MIISDIWNLEIICMPRRYLFRGSPFFLSDSEHGKLLRSFLDQRKIWSTLFSRRGLSNILIMVKLLQANGNYLIWSTQMQKVFWQTLTDLTIFSYSKFLGNFLLPSRKICSTDIKKDAVPSKLRWGHRKQMRWPTLTINTVA